MVSSTSTRCYLWWSISTSDAASNGATSVGSSPLPCIKEDNSPEMSSHLSSSSSGVGSLGWSGATYVRKETRVITKYIIDPDKKIKNIFCKIHHDIKRVQADHKAPLGLVFFFLLAFFFCTTKLELPLDIFSSIFRNRWVVSTKSFKNDLQSNESVRNMQK